jgi:hypothetical protein
LSVFAADELIVTILPERLSGFIQKVSCYQQNSEFGCCRIYAVFCNRVNAGVAEAHPKNNVRIT